MRSQIGDAAGTSEIDTPRGSARVELHRPAGRTTALLALGHGAGGDVDAPDLVALRDAALAAGLTVALVTQPYRVAGRRAPAPAAHLDEAWQTVVAAVRAGYRRPPALVVGGRSSGARVACRTAAALGAVGVVALAFPLHPPGRPDRSRQQELPAELPTLVVNGDRDPFGIPVGGGSVRVEVRPGERHDMRGNPAATARLVVDWLRGYGWAR